MERGVYMIDDEKKLLIKIAHYYYMQGMTQEQIANKVSMSRQKVNRIIGSLFEKGIVTIKINDYQKSYAELEGRIEKRFNLKQVIVTDVEDEKIEDKLGNVAAKYLESVVKDGDVISVSWGKTLAAIADSMSILKRKNISVIQCVGGTNVKDISIMTDEITRVISNKLKANPYFMYAPSIVKDENTKRVIMSEDTVKNVFKMVEKSNIALVGIGGMSEKSTLHKYNFLDKNDFSSLKSNGCVGDICFIPFDINGKLVEKSMKKRIIGIDYNTLMDIPLVIGVAGGANKKEAILGALNGNFLDVLVTDFETANYILDTV